MYFINILCVCVCVCFKLESAMVVSNSKALKYIIYCLPHCSLTMWSNQTFKDVGLSFSYLNPKES